MQSLEMDEAAKRWLTILLAIVLMIGMFFRISNLDMKPIWVGESETLSLISGYSESEAINKIATISAAEDSIVNISSFLKYRYPNSEKNLGDILQKLYASGRAPLYFLLARYWVELFGHSVATLRSLSVVLSLLTVPCLYWLCLELFGLPLVGWMAMALLSVSPIQVIYAQEAGSSSLLSLLVVFSGAALLWALRTRTKVAWITYLAALTLGFYAHYLFIFVVLGYLIYVLSIESFRFTHRSRWFWLTTFLGLLSFVPWLAIVIGYHTDLQIPAEVSQNHLTMLGAIALWSENISLLFIDLVDPKASEYMGIGKFDFYLFTPLVMILVGYSIYLLRIKTSKQVYLFILILIISTALPLIAIDLISGGNQQIWPINLFPCFLGIQISVAYSLSHKTLFTDFYQHSWHRKFWLTIAATLVTAGIIFCLIILQADTWWNKYGGEDTLSFTHIINRPKKSLIVIDRQRIESIIFYNLQPEVRLLFIGKNKLKVANFKGINDVFFLNPSPDLQAELKLHRYDLNILAQFHNPDRVYDHSNLPQLWKLKRLITSKD